MKKEKPDFDALYRGLGAARDRVGDDECLVLKSGWYVAAVLEHGSDLLTNWLTISQSPSPNDAMLGGITFKVDENGIAAGTTIEFKDLNDEDRRDLSTLASRIYALAAIKR